MSQSIVDRATTVRVAELRVTSAEVVTIVLALVMGGCSGRRTSDGQSTPAETGGTSSVHISGGAPATGGSDAATGGSDAATSGSDAATGGSQAATGGQTAADTGASPQGCKVAADHAPKISPPTSFDADAVARASVVMGSCVPDDGVDRSATHIWSGNYSAARSYFMFSVQLTCLANSNCGCAAVENCWGYQVNTAATSCTPGCNGTVFTACGGTLDLPAGSELTMDCGKWGLLCDAAAMCVPEPAVACDSYSYPSSCDASGNPSYCDDGFVRRGPPCASLDLGCVSGKCVGRGSTCTNQSIGELETVQYEGTACSGDTLMACVNGRITLIDCYTLGPGFSCQTLGTQYFCGLANQCVPATNGTPSSSNAITCDGTRVIFCNAGRLEDIDCLSLGFTGCEIDQINGRYGCT